MINYKQQGGTLLGIIIGLIVGLGIAVIVALAITKTSMPFSNKQAKPEKAIEPSAGQISDPNKPLYGNKDAAKEAAKDFAKEQENNKPAAVLEETAPPVTPAKVDNKVDNRAALADKAVADKAAADKAKKAAAESKDGNQDAPAKTDAVDDKATYFLQAGAFRDQGEAENTKAKLALLGFEARISERISDNGTLYRVRIGPFAQLDAMNRVRGKLSENGVDVAVVRIPK